MAASFGVAGIGVGDAGERDGSENLGPSRNNL